MIAELKTEWFLGQTVMARNLRPGPDWVNGVIVERLAPLSYLIETENYQYWKHHTHQLKVIDVSSQHVQPLLESTEFQEEPSCLGYVDPPITEISSNPAASPPDPEAVT